MSKTRAEAQGDQNNKQEQRATRNARQSGVVRVVRAGHSQAMATCAPKMAMNS